jgi:hypothetical protein
LRLLFAFFGLNERYRDFSTPIRAFSCQRNPLGMVSEVGHSQ